MNDFLFLATARGVYAYERQSNHSWRETTHGLSDQRVRSITARRGTILAGTHNGVFRSDDMGKTWSDSNSGLTTRYVRWMHSQDSIDFVGTEPAAIFVSRDDGVSWNECVEVTKLRDANGWFLPYSSGAGCIRGFATHGSRAYAAAEVGGLLHSDDDGLSWELVEGSSGKPNLGAPREKMIHPDVHSLATHPSSPDLIFAPTGGGYYHSDDGGKTWELLYRCYCRAVWIDPKDAHHHILGPADSVDSNGRIEETNDNGKTWHAASKGLSVLWRHHMVERFAQIGDELFGVLSNGSIIAAPLATLEWRPVFSDTPDTHAIAWTQG